MADNTINVELTASAEMTYEEARRIVEAGPPPAMFSEHASLRVAVARPATNDERRRHVLARLMNVAFKDGLERRTKPALFTA